jgi:MoxR-like ATPase
MLLLGLENDRYVRKTDGYLPTAEVAFVDEIFKANSAILNALLTLLNERLFDNGNQRLPVPLLCLVGASNELPESEELDALYDRFLIRRTVAQVSEDFRVTLLWLPYLAFKCLYCS